MQGQICGEGDTAGAPPPTPNLGSEFFCQYINNTIALGFLAQKIYSRVYLYVCCRKNNMVE